MSRSIRILAVLVAALAVPLGLASRASAQVIPGAPVVEVKDQTAQWAVYARATADSLMRDWISVAEREEPAIQARFFTDRAVLASASGETAMGREEIASLLASLPERSDYRLQVSDLELGARLLRASGRVRYQENGQERTETFVSLLEQHRGRWLFRALAFAPADPDLARAVMGQGTLTPHRKHLAPPERALVRLVVEPLASREFQQNTTGMEPWSGYGVGLGLEFNRTLELRGFGWQHPEHLGGEPLRSYGGELRMYPFEWWRVRPLATAGVVRFEGAGAPDTAWVPVVGGGLSVRLFSHLDAQVAYRSHLVANSDGTTRDNWLTRKRAQRPAVSVGLSFALGNRPAWKDSQSEVSRVVSAVPAGEVLAVLSAWDQALQQGDRAAAGAHYGSLAELYHGGGAVRGREAILDALQELRAAGLAQVGQVTVSGDVAYAELSESGTESPRRMLAVLQREGRDWKIRAQILR